MDMCRLMNTEKKAQLKCLCKLLLCFLYMETVGLRNLSDFYWQTKVAIIWRLKLIELNTRITAKENIELEYNQRLCAEPNFVLNLKIIPKT